MKSFPDVLTDPVYRPQKDNFLNRVLYYFINDKRDLPFARLIFRIQFFVILPGILLFFNFWNDTLWWVTAVIYFYVSQFYFKGRFGLMLHCICHRKLFKKQFSYLQTYVIWVLCPFFGHTPESYFSHHIGMHHMENNMPDDDSSTMAYQRDSLRSFLKYYFDFLLLGFRDTLRYLYYRKRRKMFVRLSWGESAFYVLCIGLCFVNLKAALVVFIIPFFFARLVMMLGNWTQHAFVDQHDPENIYTNSIICINTKYNHVCWNDGYHTIHHLRPGMHYTELPGEFLRLRDKLSSNKTLVFEGIHYLHVFIYLMRKRYDLLEKNLVNLDGNWTKDMAMETMRQRTARFKIVPEKREMSFGLVPGKKILEDVR